MDADGVGLLAKLDGMLVDLGFTQYTEYVKTPLDVVCITAALMLGTAGLPHVIIRFYTVKTVRGARSSAGWALLFIAILYTTAPAIAVFARTNMLETVPDRAYSEAPSWVATWEDTGLMTWVDKNDDGVIQHTGGGGLRRASPSSTSTRTASRSEGRSRPAAGDQRRTTWATRTSSTSIATSWCLRIRRSPGFRTG